MFYGVGKEVMKLTSIIMCRFDFTRVQNHITIRSLADIRRFTNDDEYELIIVDNEPKHRIRDDFKVLRLEDIKFIINEKDIGYYKSLNQGAEIAKGEYLCFIQPDVFVNEGWLEGMRYYLDNGIADVVFPDQFPQTREYIKKSYEMSFEEGQNFGGRDAGCLMITRKGFDKTGGWDDRLFNEFGEAAFYDRIDKAGLKWTATCKSLVTHLSAATRYMMWDLYPEVHIADMAKDGKKWGEIKNES